MPGSLVLVGGEPGIGKSTLLLQAAAGMSRAPPGRLRAVRDGRGIAGAGASARGRLGLLRASAGGACASWPSTTSGGSSRSRGPSGPALVIVDSIQTATVDELDGPAGSVGQVRESALRLMELAKGDGIAVVLVGHVTKDGSIAGPKTLEHLVDAVISLEGERLRGPAARCGPPRTGSARPTRSACSRWPRSGCCEVADPARAFLADHGGPAPGSVVAPTLEGSRPLLVEVQALVSPSRLRHAGAQGERRWTRTGSAC